MNPTTAAHSTPNKKPPQCHFWLKGTCKNGEACRYSHDGAVANPQTAGTPSTHQSSTPDERKSASKIRLQESTMKGTGTLLSSVKSSTDLNLGTETVRLENFEFLASYNWKDCKEPVIFVPGSPARWNPPALPIQLKRDHGKTFIDQNNARSQLGGFDSFFKALLTMHPSFDMTTVNLVSNRNSLRKLLDFTFGRIEKQWRIEIDIVGGTMFFSRCEPHNVVHVPPHHESYGREFEKNFTRFDGDSTESSGHHRIARYDLGGLKFMVRFEVDGYDNLPGSENDLGELPSSSVELSEDLINSLSGMNLDTSSSDTLPPTRALRGEVTVIRKGRLVNPSSTIEIKSCIRVNHKLHNAMPQLYLSQTHRMYAGTHLQGLISSKDNIIKYIIDKQAFKDWEDKEQIPLKLLVALITFIRETADKNGGDKFVLVAEKEGSEKTLKIFERGGKGIFLPDGVRETCWPGKFTSGTLGRGLGGEATSKETV